MEQVIDSWELDPNKLLKPNDSLYINKYNNNHTNKGTALYTPESQSNAFMNSNANNNTIIDKINDTNSIDSNNKVAANNNCTITTTNNVATDDLFDMNYYDIDNFLTQELRDLDIPMLPNTQDSSITNGDDQLLNWNGYSNCQNNNNSSNYGIIEDTGNNIYTNKSQNMPSHKRGLSGTAIFGFTNHNKTLSISSLQRSGLENIPISINTDNKNRNFPIVLNQFDEKDSNITNDLIEQEDEVSKLIFRQQQELRQALEKQKLVNRKLQEQLRANQLQQERLQRALEEQTNRTSPVLRNNKNHQTNNNASPSPQRSYRTPAKMTTEDELIVTSNSADGKYQFPPPSMLSPALSNTSLTGSPIKKSHNRTRNPIFSLSNSLMASSLSPNKCKNNLSNFDDKINDLFQDMNDEANKKTVIEPLNSPFFNLTSPSFRSQKHLKKESVTSTVSTIPLSVCDSDIETANGQELLGLGITLADDQNDKDNKYSSSNDSNIVETKIINKARQLPAKVEIMPTIPASSENTPMKQSLSQNKEAGTSINDSRGDIPQKHIFQHTPIKQKPEMVVINDTTTPVLQPPLNFANISSSNSIFQRTTLSPSYMGERTVVLGSPQMPPPVETLTGPIKITRKLSTLPRGCIDQYVKELPDKQYLCLYPGCGKHFKRRYNIRTHIQTHLEDRPYVCDYPGCDRAFVRNHDLIRHKKLHLNRSFSCPCGKKFADGDLLKQHQSLMLCQNIKKYDNFMVIKKTATSSPTRNSTVSASESPAKKYRDSSESPVKRSVETDNTGYVQNKLEEQLSLKYTQQYTPRDDKPPIESPSTPSSYDDLHK